MNIVRWLIVVGLWAGIGLAPSGQKNSLAEGSQPAPKKSWLDRVVKLTDDNFEAQAIKSPKPILIEFWAGWSGPSRGLVPTLEAVANKYDDTLKFGRVDVDHCPVVCQKYKVEAIPLVVVFKDGRERERITGPAKQEQIEQMIERHVEKGK
jgi:thioredoxin